MVKGQPLGKQHRTDNGLKEKPRKTNVRPSFALSVFRSF